MKEYQIQNILYLKKRNITIDKTIILRYPFLQEFLFYDALFFEDAYYSIFYIQYFENNSDDEISIESLKKYKNVKKIKISLKHPNENIIIYNYIIDKLQKSYIKNSMNYIEVKDALLNIQFSSLKRSFIYSNLHLSGYEGDMNNDINEWLNSKYYEDIVYIYPYISKKIEFEGDYFY